MPNQKQQTAELKTTEAAPKTSKAAKTSAAPKAGTIPKDPKSPRAKKASPATKVAADASQENGDPKTPKTPRKKAVKAVPLTFEIEPAQHGISEALLAETPDVTYEMIAVRAYFLAENRHSYGHPGDHAADWHEAERQLRAEATAIAASLRKAR
ncbi:MAG: Protein of unknown function (DUF2934) [Verrucomicrobia bacterium]|nr:MAG: Protein of unknown function (DUF2934) [Verrucomicrobiota bacterium]